jgi:hypothetical protein
MPSVSGGALRRIALDGTSELRIFVRFVDLSETWGAARRRAAASSALCSRDLGFRGRHPRRNWAVLATRSATAWGGIAFIRARKDQLAPGSGALIGGSLREPHHDLACRAHPRWTGPR